MKNLRMASGQHPESTCSSDVNYVVGEMLLCKSVPAGAKHADQCRRATVVQVWIASTDL